MSQTQPDRALDRALDAGRGRLASPYRSGVDLARLPAARRLAFALRVARAELVNDLAGRAALWAPVVTGAGVVLYFAAPFEPTLIMSAGVFVVACLIAIILRLAGAGRIAGALFCLALGFFAADGRAARVDAPTLDRDLSVRKVEGRLLSVDEGDGRRRLVIAVERIDRLDTDKTPARIRVNWRGAAFDVRPGDRVFLRAGLSPPPGPVAPGAYPFSRQLYFERIGAVGFAVSAPQRLDDPRRSVSQRVDAAIEGVRFALARRILDKAPGEGGAIVAAVVTGKRGAIDEASAQALRDSGLAHLLAISGLHMGLATGIIFFVLRLGLASHERLALRYPVKKWAAAAALLAGLAYLLLSGGGWSARRAFIMTSIVFIAVLTDRRAFSLRNVAAAAMIILVTTPEAVLHPGFQMSFAAVTALIAAYEWAEARPRFHDERGFFVRIRRYVVGVGITDTIAAVATAPYGLYHFHRAALYSLPANLAAMPLMGFWIMPAAVAALVLTPLGLDGPFWRLAAAGMDVVLAVARGVADQPGAVATSPFWPPAALGVLSLGGLWLCIQRSRLRLAGLAAVPLAALLIAAAPRPVLFVSRDADNAGVLVRGDAGETTMAMMHVRRDAFAADGWTEIAGGDPASTPREAMAAHFPCDASGCVVDLDGETISILTDRLALAEDCRRADWVIALYSVTGAERDACAAALVNFWDIRDRGPHMIARQKGRLIVVDAGSASHRPWAGR